MPWGAEFDDRRCQRRLNADPIPRLDALGSERAILLCSGLGPVAALLLSGRRPVLTGMASLAAAAAVALLVALPPVFEIRPWPHKRLAVSP